MKYHVLGKFGEEWASKFLEKRGYKILARNYSKSLGGRKMAEIDIITQDKQSAMDRFLGRRPTLVFVEVKTGTSFYGELSPDIRVNKAKRDKIARLAEIWLSEQKVPLDSPWRIDVIAVNKPDNPMDSLVNHIQNI